MTVTPLTAMAAVVVASRQAFFFFFFFFFGWYTYIYRDRIMILGT